MLESIFLTVNAWMVSGTAIAGVGCFTWGMISVLFSPCHLASIPLIVAYVGGQAQALNPKQAGVYSSLFTLGLFISIALIGIVCALLGRMLGDIGNYWQILVGAVLIWVALGMLGVEKCSISGSLLYRLNLKGLSGAFGLGLAYGILSGSCTFGFIAPILAIITVQQKIAAVSCSYSFLQSATACRLWLPEAQLRSCENSWKTAPGRVPEIGLDALPELSSFFWASILFLIR